MDYGGLRIRVLLPIAGADLRRNTFPREGDNECSRWNFAPTRSRHGGCDIVLDKGKRLGRLLSYREILIALVEDRFGPLSEEFR